MKNNIKQSLVVIAIVSIAVSSSLLIYKINIHSDILFLEYLMQDIFNHNGNWSYWKFSPAPSYFPDMFLYALGYYFIDTVPLRIFFVTIAQIALIAFLGDWLAKKIRPKVSVIARSLILFFLFVTIITANYAISGIGIFFNANNIQVPTLISSILLLGLYISFLNHPKFIIAVLIIILGGVAQASSAVFVISFAIPYFLVLTFLLFFYKKQKDNSLFKTACISLAILTISQVFGYFLSSILTYNSPLNGRLPFSIQAVENSIYFLIHGTINILNPSNPWSLFTFIIFSIAFLYALSKSFHLGVSSLRQINSYDATYNLSDNQSSLVELIASLFLIFSAVISIAGSILSGGFADDYGYRYFMTFIAISLILAAIFIEKDISVSNGIKLQLVIAASFIIITIFSVLNIIFSENKRKISEIISLGAVYRPEEDIARCINDISKSGVKLYSGIGDFWNSRGIQFYLKNSVFIQPTLNNLSPFFWISSAESIVDPMKYKIERYNFVILRNENKPSQFGYDIKLMKDYLPDGFEMRDCNQSDAKILIYDNDKLDKKLKAIFGNFAFNEFGVEKITYSATQLFSQIGSVIDGVRIASDSDSPGFIIFGPYVNLQAGNYLFESKLKASSRLQDAPIGHVEVGRFDVADKQVILEKANILTDTDNLAFKFTVPKGGIENLETRIYFNGTGNLQIDNLSIQRLN